MPGLLLPQEAKGRPPLVGGEGGSGKPSLLSLTKSVVFKSTHRLPQNAEEGNRPAEIARRRPWRKPAVRPNFVGAAATGSTTRSGRRVPRKAAAPSSGGGAQSTMA
ncbi:hypothetical protein ZWY2020_026036 [Hordeum vulgare]|nr:hypothetical protein ZWY2020_026036 [Hordeum vulgare]